MCVLIETGPNGCLAKPLVRDRPQPVLLSSLPSVSFFNAIISSRLMLGCAVLELGVGTSPNWSRAQLKPGCAVLELGLGIPNLRYQAASPVFPLCQPTPYSSVFICAFEPIAKTCQLPS